MKPKYKMLRCMFCRKRVKTSLKSANKNKTHMICNDCLSIEDRVRRFGGISKKEWKNLT